MNLLGSLTISCLLTHSGVRLAVDDLARDLGWVLGQPGQVTGEPGGRITVAVDPALPGPEAWRITFAGGRVTITGSEPLGLIHGIYAFSGEVLGVDPLWFWKGLRPAPKAALDLSDRVLVSRPPTFRYRGWFINDEDLLTEFKPASGPRDIRYPFYATVINLDLADRIFEALLRCRGNLIIPASFVDVLNEPEAELVRRAVARGLFVTQHHIEPLGVSHFGFENYWTRRGESVEFSYGAEPERVREVWRAFAAKWWELAGEQVIWQLGLRGKGDRAIWSSDRSVSRAEAGRFISRAIAEQWEIVKQFDTRPRPPATATLWAELSDLMAAGELTFPPGVMFVFSDNGKTQRMQADFRDTPRTAEHPGGVYYHLAYWIEGPHLVQGTPPGRLKEQFDAIVGKGDTAYAIVNVSNIREHVLGVEAAMEIMNDHAGWTEAEFWRRFAPPELSPLYQRFLAAIPERQGQLLQDGTVYLFARNLVRDLAAGGAKPSPWAPLLPAAIAELTAVLAAYDALPPRPDAPYREVHLRLQAEVLRDYYRLLLALSEATGDRAKLAEAEAALTHLLEVRQRAEAREWAGWYTGDRKENLPGLLAALRKLGGG